MEKPSVALRELVVAVAGPRKWSDTRESWLARASRKSGVSYRTIKSIYYGEIEDPLHPAVRLLRYAARPHRFDLASRVERAARSMEQADPDFFEQDIAALVDVARALRGLGGSRDDQV
jgi:hypothetical protein